MYNPNNAARRPVFSKRWLLAAISIFVLLLLGLVYAWSIFVAPLEQEFGWQRAETSLAFSICMSMFCVGGIFSGLLLRRCQTRTVIAVCAVGLLAGFGLASRLDSLSGLYVSYGLLVGFAVGAGYNAILSAVLRWFPEKIGLVSGLLMMGFGLGGMVLGTVGSKLIASLGWRSTFLLLGAAFAAVVALAAIFITTPGPGETAARQANAAKKSAHEPGLEIETGKMLRLPSFWVYYAWTVALSAAGLMLIGHAVPLAGGFGVTPERAAFMAGFISIFNGLGRVVMGFAFDRLGYKWVMRLVSAGFIISGAILVRALGSGSASLALAGFILAGLSYGGILPTNSSVISSFYGMKNYAMNFSMINTCLIAASFLGPYLAGVLHGASGSYNSTSLIMIVFGAFGLLLAFLLPKFYCTISRQRSEFGEYAGSPSI